MRLGIPTFWVLDAIDKERKRQDEKWGEQSHPNGTGGPHGHMIARLARDLCNAAAEEGTVTWRHIAREEFCEALAERDDDLLLKELIQTAAVLVAWIEDINRRSA